ncbi:MAG: transporter [Carnobacterium sp.]|uniref:lipopolysaccharide biosynthesis protein n=1 Tax=Carnobacterium sp. TaxID=48221 RepID=UPI003315DD63
MKEESRTRNSLRNISVGFTSQILNLILNFVSRTIFIKVLGVEFLGLNGLFSNILLILSLADLGIDSAMIFSLYKPLADKNYPLINALVTFYKKVYQMIAVAVAVIGLSLVPFLGYLINVENNIPYLEIYYIIFLLNSVVSYLFVYKTSVIEADQKNFLIRIYSVAFEFFKIIAQSVLLILTHNYFIYLLLNVIFSLLKNATLAYRANKLYPFLSEPAEKLNGSTKKQIYDNVKSMFMYKIGGVLLNNTDNILISVMLGTIWVGYYSNYYLIITGLTSFTSILFTSLSSSVGNLIASSEMVTNDGQNNGRGEDIYNGLSFVSFWIYGIGAICLFVLFNDFITIWLNASFTLSILTVLAIVLNFYISGILSVTTIYRNTTGLFRDIKYIFLYTATVNLILSVVLGQVIGLPGILIATFIARLVVNFWYEPLMLYKIYFQKKSNGYFFKQIKYFIVLFFSIAVIYGIDSFIASPSFLNFIIRATVYFLVLNVLFFALFKNTNEMKFLLSKINPILTSANSVLKKSSRTERK